MKTESSIESAPETQELGENWWDALVAVATGVGSIGVGFGIYKGIEAVVPLALDNPEISGPTTVVAGLVAMGGVARHMARRI